MKLKTILIACVAMFATTSAMAQEQTRTKIADMTREQRVEMKAQMFAKKLMLDDATKAKFLPMYVSYQNELYKSLPTEVREKMEARKEVGKRIAADRKRTRDGKDYADKRMHRKGVHKGRREHRMCEEFDGKTDAEVKAMIEKRFATQQARLDINKKYFKKFNRILTVKQSAAVLHSSKAQHHAMKDRCHGMKKHHSCIHKGQVKRSRK